MAAAPPPLHPRPGHSNGPVPPPPLSSSPSGLTPNSPSSDKRRSMPLIIGLCIAGVALITALVLWLLVLRSSDDDTYSSGDNNSDKEWLNDSNANEPVVPADPEEIVVREPIAGYGFNDKMPFYISLEFDGDNVSGRFTNVIYGLQFPVSGTVTGSAYDLNIGTGNERSHMMIHDIGGYEFTGTWGKSDSPVSAYLQKNASPSSPSTSSLPFRYEGKFSGGGVTHDVVLLFSSRFDSGIMYYPRIGIEYAMNFVNTDPESSTFTLYAQGRNVATLRLNFDYDDLITGTMIDAKGGEFSLNLSES